MHSLLLLAAMAQIQVDPATVVIFGREAWYQAVRGDEESFIGVLQRIPGTGRESRNAFCIVMAADGKNNTREVFIGTGNPNLLPFLNRRVRLTGMSVDLKVDGRMRYEIWPAKLEVAGGGPIIVGGMGGDPVNIITSTDWGVTIGPGAVPLIGTGQIQLLCRNPDQLLNAMGGKQKSVDNLYRSLNVKNIDFRRNMVLFVSGGICRGAGHTVEITNLTMNDQTLQVRWALRSPAGNPALGNLTHPSKVLIIPRSDGPVRFDPIARR